MKKTALLLIILTIISKLIGLGREIVLSYFYGASSISDAYLIALIIPTVISTFSGSIISTTFIPMYNKLEVTYGEKEADKYTNNMLNLLLIFSCVLIVLGYTFTKQIVKVFASGFEGETLNLAIQFTKISLIGLLFIGIMNLFKNYLQLKNNFSIPALVGLPMNIVIIFTIILSSFSSIKILPVGLVVATFSQLLFLIPFILKKGFKYKPVLNPRDKNIKQMLYLALPVLIGVGVNDLNKIVDKTIASNITTGGISALTYANNLNNFVHGIFVLSISTAMYPLISRFAINNNFKELKKVIIDSIEIIIIFLIPATIGIIIFSQPIIEILYGRGAFGENAVNMTAQVLLFYSLGMFSVGMREILSRPFYALQNTKVPVINASIGLLINIILNLALSKYFGIGGLALATSLSSTVTALLMYNSLRKMIGKLSLNSVYILLIKCVVAALVMGFFAYSLDNVFNNYFNRSLSLLVSIASGATIYFLLLDLFQVAIVKKAFLSAIKK